jgi:hypothetical protein
MTLPMANEQLAAGDEQPGRIPLLKKAVFLDYSLRREVIGFWVAALMD